MGLLLAGTLHADKITYITGSGSKEQVKFVDNITITGWSASKVTYKTDKDQSTSVDYKEVLSLDRHYGSMSSELSDALDLVGSNPKGAIDALAQVARSGNSLDREEASIIRAQLLDNASANDPAYRSEAMKAYGAYLSSWKAGYFAREAYKGLAVLQENGRQVGAARTTLRNMAKADRTMQREGNQLLGEFEGRHAKWSDAINAFKAAQSAARSERDTSSEALGKAWEGWMTLKAGKAKDATALLESVTGDDSLDDPDTTTDEIALSVAYPALGDAQFAAGKYEKAYNAFIKGAYYAWWSGGNKEGHCLGQAFLCAKKLEGTDDKWTKRKDKLHTALALGFPRILQKVEKE
jgi:hypothetical protein